MGYPLFPFTVPLAPEIERQDAPESVRPHPVPFPQRRIR